MTARMYFVYMLASKQNGTLYIGMTNNLLKRADQHRNRQVEGFTARYGVKRLVYYESFRNVTDAINREKQMKKWNRQWKINLIEKANPQWRDLFEEMAAAGGDP